MSAGSFIGALAAGAICDSVGRRKSLMLASIIWIIGSAIQCSSQNVAQLIVGRIVSGLAVGITSSQVVSDALVFSMFLRRQLSRCDIDTAISGRP
jgi:MFS family permease